MAGFEPARANPLDFKSSALDHSATLSSAAKFTKIVAVGQKLASEKANIKTTSQMAKDINMREGRYFVFTCLLNRQTLTGIQHAFCTTMGNFNPNDTATCLNYFVFTCKSQLCTEF